MLYQREYYELKDVINDMDSDIYVIIYREHEQ